MTNPVRVLHILQRMEAGGTQALLMNLYRKIDRTKIQFDFLVVYEEEQFYDDEIELLGGHIYKFSFREDMNVFRFKKQLRQFFSLHKEYQIVHCHAYTIGFFCLSEAKRAEVPVRIAHSHNNETIRDWKYFPKLILQKLYTLYATDLMACSDEAGKYLFKNKEFIILKNAIDSDKFVFNEETRTRQLLSFGLENKFVVGNVGRLHPQKNQKFLIDIFVELKKIKEDSVLLVIGSGPLESELKDYARIKKVDDSVLFLGVRKNINEIMQAFDVLALPSLFEGLGIVVIEAQAAGTPVVTSLGVPEETEITPLITRLSLSDSSETWAKALVDSSNNSLSRKNAQEYIKNSGYDLRDSVAFVQSFYLTKQNNKE